MYASWHVALIILQWLKLSMLKQIFMVQIMFEPFKFHCMFQSKKPFLQWPDMAMLYYIYIYIS